MRVLALSALLLVLAAATQASAGELSGVVVDHNGEPVPWISTRVLNSTTKNYTRVQSPSIRIELVTVRGMTRTPIGYANAEPDGSFVISWSNDAAVSLACELRVSRVPPLLRVGADLKEGPVPVTTVRLMADDEGDIDPEQPENAAVTRPIVLRESDEDSLQPRQRSNMGRAKGKKAKDNK